jgi:hypothetical protein
MFNPKALTRLFFGFSFAVFCGAGAQRVLAQEALQQEFAEPAAKCLDGDRSLCWSGPVDGGTGYKYWV